MRVIVTALALLLLTELLAAPASADCISDMRQARALVDQLPEGRQKRIAERQLRLAKELRGGVAENRCVIRVAVCLAPPSA